MQPLLHHPLAGTRLPVLLLAGRPVPVPGARWTLLVLGRGRGPEVDAVRGSLTAEAVAAMVLPATADAAPGTLLLDPQGVVQHVGASVEEALDAVRGFRTGDRTPIPFARSQPVERCAVAGRHRAATTRRRQLRGARRGGD